MRVQGLTLNLEVRKSDKDKRGLARFDCEEINDSGRVIETWEIQFRIDPNQLRCMSIKGREAERALDNDRDKLDPTRGFRILDADNPGRHPIDNDEGAL